MSMHRQHTLAFIAAFATIGTPGAGKTQIISTRFEGGRFIAAPITKSGVILRLLVDTGGGGSNGMYWIRMSVARQLGLKPMACLVNGYDLSTYKLPAFARGRALPEPKGPCRSLLAIDATEPSPLEASLDGLIGATYLLNGIWTFDYRERRLLHEVKDWVPSANDRELPVGFVRDTNGNIQIGFPRITVFVDSQPLNLLLDTGATAKPTDIGRRSGYTCGKAMTCATSYITTTVLNGWQRAHPDWRIVRGADDLFARPFVTRAIEVPSIKIAGLSVGPVWFTERPDDMFHGSMNEWMDRRIDGALGGNALAPFSVTIDYPTGKGWIH